MEDRETLPLGQLFNSINYYNLKDLDVLTSNLSKEQALYCLLEAIKYAHSFGIFSLEESEVISKIIRTLSTNE